MKLYEKLLKLRKGHNYSSGSRSKIDKKVWLWGCFIALTLLVLLLIFVGKYFLTMNRQIDELQDKINMLEVSLEEAKNNSMDIQYTAPPDYQNTFKNNLLSSFDAQLIKKDVSGNALVYNLSATPKEFHENDIGEFILNDGVESKTIPAELKDGTYQAELSFPRDSKVSTLLFKITNGENFETEPLGNTHELFGQLQSEYNLMEIPSCELKPGLSKAYFSGNLSVDMYSAHDSNGDIICYPTSVKLLVKQNEKVIKELPFDIANESEQFTTPYDNNSVVSMINFNRNMDNISIKVKNSSIPVNCDLVFTDNWNTEMVIPLF